MAKRIPKEDIYDCVVIGAGPGGLVSALYLARFNRRVALVDKGESRAKWIPKVRNLVAHSNGISGKQLLDRLYRQLKFYAVSKIKGEAIVRRVGRGFEVDTPHRTLRCRFVILATGMQDKNPSLENIEDLRHRRLLSYCPICDGYEYNHKRIGLIVKDNKGLRKMRFLRNYSKHLFIFKTKPFVTASAYIKEITEGKIKVFENTLDSLAAGDHGKTLKVFLKGKRKDICVDVAYVEMGVTLDKSVTSCIRRLRRTGAGFILTDAHQQTSVKGMYAVGDCVNGLSQISVAVGHAAIAATRIHNLLN